MFADGPSRSPIGVLKSTMNEAMTTANMIQIIRLRSPKMSPMNGMSSISGRCTLGIRSSRFGVPSVPYMDRNR